MTGMIDIHSHLLPGIDDGCATLAESLECARTLVELGYTHSFCTPHIWPSLPKNQGPTIRSLVNDLQDALDENKIPLKLFPGGEHNLRPDIASAMLPSEIVTYGLARKHVLMDLWAERLPEWFDKAVRWFQAQGLTVILAHPERMRAVQQTPELADQFRSMGMLLQGNLQCFGDAPHTATRRTAERFLAEDRYFALGSDLHGPGSLAVRISGLNRVRELLTKSQLDRLMIEHPRVLLGDLV